MSYSLVESQIELGLVNAFDIGYNIINGERAFNSATILIKEGVTGRSTESQLSNNIFQNNRSDFGSATDGYISFNCNHHDNTSNLAYRTADSTENQGGNNNPAGNIFNTSLSAYHISSAANDDYEYYYDELNAATEPDLAPNSAVLTKKTKYPFESTCELKDNISLQWANVDLCPPELFWSEEDCYDICTLCMDCEDWPPSLNTGKITEPIQNTVAFSQGDKKDDDASAEIELKVIADELVFESIDLNINYTVFIRDIMGRLVHSLEMNADTKVSTTKTLNSGLYIGTIHDDTGHILSSRYIYIP